MILINFFFIYHSERVKTIPVSVSFPKREEKIKRISQRLFVYETHIHNSTATSRYQDSFLFVTGVILKCALFYTLFFVFAGPMSYKCWWRCCLRNIFLRRTIAGTTVHGPSFL